MKIQAQCEADTQTARNDVASIRSKADRERGKDRARLNVALAESESRFNLVQAKCHTYGNLLDFVRTMHASEPRMKAWTSLLMTCHEQCQNSRTPV